MPRIRKKTSKRGTTHQRAKIKKKVSESRRKAKREAKKNPQWKSKHKKDPGIPNDFPFKEQILAEVAAQRLREQEEKQRRKEQKKAATAGTKQDKREDEDEPLADFGEINSLVLRSPPMNGTAADGQHVGEDEDDAPILINREYTNLRSVLDKADVVLNVLDARDSFACRSSHLEEYVRTKEGKKLVFVLNKIDACPREVTEVWVSELRRHAMTCLFRSASMFLPQAADTTQRRPSTKHSKTDKPSLSDAVGTELLLNILASEAKKKDDGLLYVAIVGIANAGKSSLMNSLLQKSSSPIYKLTSTPSCLSTTERPLEAIIEREERKIVLVDTPALSWEKAVGLVHIETKQQHSRDMLLCNKGRIDKAKDPISPVTDIVARANNEDLMLFYNLPAFSPGAVDAFLAALARAHGFVKRRGELEIASAARVVLRDWSTGKLPWYAQPAPLAATASIPVTEGAIVEGSVSKNAPRHASAEETILSTAAPTRKEMRLGRGIVRLVPGEVQGRRVVMDAPWDRDLDRNGEEEEVIARANGKEKLMRLPGLGEGLLDAISEDEDDEDEEDFTSMDSEMDDEDGKEVIEEDDDDEEIQPPALPPSLPSKRRHELDETVTPARKKVTFMHNPPKHNPVRKPVKCLLEKATVKRRSKKF